MRQRIFDSQAEYRKAYYQIPEVRERQRMHSKNYKQRPDVKIKIREYNREYMKEYWKENPERYDKFKKKVAECNKLRIENEAKKKLDGLEIE